MALLSIGGVALGVWNILAVFSGNRATLLLGDTVALLSGNILTLLVVSISRADLLIGLGALLAIHSLAHLLIAGRTRLAISLLKTIE